MAFLRLNGVTIPVGAGSAQRSGSLVADDGETERARPIIQAGGFVDSFAGSVPCLDPDEAEGFRGLIEGLGHRWAFDSDLFSSRGRGPEAGFSATLIGAGGKFGGYVSVTSITFDVALGPRWAVLVWRLESGTWRHYMIRSDGAKWFEGVRDDGLDVTFFSSGLGRIALGGAPTGYDDLVFLPFSPSSDVLEALHAWTSAGTPFSALPRLVSDGDWTEEATMIVTGETGAAEYLHLGSRSSTARWTNTARLLPFTIRRVAP